MTRHALPFLALLVLAACARQVTPGAVEASAPGFLWGLWHGFIFPFAFIGSLVSPEIAVYAVPNNGGWYDFGYFIGVVFLGAGSWRSRKVVYRTREVPARRGQVIDHE